ncbi:hypothetical protein AOQ84DRAFT_353695 [Glonium stellatum]|uniref:Uncharacterized protein n=1 Tax=Glonium stellatum TaxID=574774 RepID=A0A8E2JUX1_9PEZI|nr:hypothetical protein AOQ84DRAFT_353695 [Glonium stellatum]
MPADRYNVNNSRPLMPTLATNRTAKTPITPRLAASVTSTNTSSSRRPERSDTGNTPKGNSVAREDLTTPVKTFLSSNVTPRSSSRKSRVGTGSAQSTPNGTPGGTPTSSRPGSTIDTASTKEGNGFSGLGINGFHGASASGRTRSMVNGGTGYQNTSVNRSPMLNIQGASSSDIGAPKESSQMFFHALDPRSQDPSPIQRKPPAFFYANGKEDESSARSAGMPSPPLSSVERTRSHIQFFHADSTSELKNQPPLLTPPLATASHEPASFPAQSQKPLTLHPPSPSKDNIHPSYRKGVSQVIRPSTRNKPSAISILPGHPYSNIAQPHSRDSDHERSARRRSSAGTTSTRVSHVKSASLSSIDSVTSAKKGFHGHAETLSLVTPSPLHRESRVVSSGSVPESIVSAPTPPKEDFLGLPLSVPQSPTKSTGQSALQKMNELAANARRERKVLDLEISNSSLLAINRQLEREVRKQKAELRRFRRLSRAGQFSSCTLRSSMEDLSTIGDNELGDLSDTLEEAEDPGGEDERDDYTSESSVDEETLSPGALADRDANYRIKDEKRLQLDLSKHRELLVDSQKMNQSLKRCLGWTEDLIKEGKKALEYRVHVSDVKLGGRVLEELHVDQGTEHRQGGTLLSAWTLPDRDIDYEDRASLGSERTDRDSGVELEGLKQLQQQEQDHEQSIEGSEMGESPSRPPRSTDITVETF